MSLNSLLPDEWYSLVKQQEMSRAAQQVANKQAAQERDKWNENHRVMCRVEHELRQQLVQAQAEIAQLKTLYEADMGRTLPEVER